MLITMIPFQTLRVKGHSSYAETASREESTSLASTDRRQIVKQIQHCITRAIFKKVPVNIIVLGQELLLIKILLFWVCSKSRMTYLLNTIDWYGIWQDYLFAVSPGTQY